MGRNFLAVSVLIAAFCCAVSSLDLANVLSNIPKEDVLEFVKHHAQRGYELEASQLMDIQLSASDEFSIELYNYLLQNNAIDSQNTHILAACVICFPNGKCVDICDPGVHP
jgi:hypothetical protein